MVEFKTGLESEEWDRRAAGRLKFLIGIFALIKILITGKPTTVTSVIDRLGTHSTTGRHPQGRAADLRSRDMTEQESRLVLNLFRPIAGIFGGVIILEPTHYHLHV